jgi:hypothetical protein
MKKKHELLKKIPIPGMLFLAFVHPPERFPRLPRPRNVALVALRRGADSMV